MADNVAITAGSGTTVATDEVTINAVAVQVQRIKNVVGKDGTYTGDVGGRNVDGDANSSAMFVDQRSKRVAIAVTPTVSTSPAYTAKDCVGSYMTFANAVRASAGSGVLERVQVADYGQQMKDLELVLINVSISGTSTATDNSIWAPVDADTLKIIGIVPIPAGSYSDYSTNSVADIPCYLPFSLAGTSLIGLLIARGTPTYTSTTDITVTLEITQD